MFYSLLEVMPVFDAKSILESLVRGAAQSAPSQGQGGGGLALTSSAKFSAADPVRVRLAVNPRVVVDSAISSANLNAAFKARVPRATRLKPQARQLAADLKIFSVN